MEIDRKQCRIIAKDPANSVSLAQLKNAPEDSGSASKAAHEKWWLRFPEVFREEPPLGLPLQQEVEHTIEVLFGSSSLSRGINLCLQIKLQEMKKQLDQLLKNGYVRVNSSLYRASVIFVNKKTGELCICIDYHALNAITLKNKYPLLRVDEIFDRLPHAN